MTNSCVLRSSSWVGRLATIASSSSSRVSYSTSLRFADGSTEGTARSVASELEAVLKDKIVDKGLDLFVLAITDILNNDSVALAIGSKTDAVERAYGVTLENNTALLKGVVSRKSQIVPVLTKAFEA